MSLRDLALESLEQAINGYLGLDPRALEQLQSLQGKLIAIELDGLGERLYLLTGNRRLLVLGATEETPDCTISGTPLALARMAEKREGQQQLFRGEVRIEGDTELAHRFSKLLGSLQIDWEEQLSRLTGDAVAHQGMQWLRDLEHWGNQARSTLSQDVSEYLQQEQQVLATREQLDRFCEDVDQLRDRLERLQARINRLNR